MGVASDEENCSSDREKVRRVKCKKIGHQIHNTLVKIGDLLIIMRGSEKTL